MAALTVDINANSAAAQKAIADLAGSLQGVGDGFDLANARAAAAEGDIQGVLAAIVDMGKQAGLSGDQVAEAISTAYGVPLERAQDAVEMLSSQSERSFERVSDAASDSEDGFDDAGEAAGDMGDSVEDGAEAGQDGLKDLSAEAKNSQASLRQVGDSGEFELGRIKTAASRFRGTLGKALNFGEDLATSTVDVTNFGDVARSVLGNVASVIGSAGPAGIVGALALAAGSLGLGAVIGGINDAADRQQALNDKAGELVGVYANAALGVADAAAVMGGVMDIQNDTAKYNDAVAAAQEWGVLVPTAMRAIAGDATALALVQESLTQKTDDYISTLDPAEQALADMGGGLSTLSPELQSAYDRMFLLQDAMGIARSRASDGARALYELAVANGTATGATDELGNAIYTLPGGKEVVINALTRQAYEDIAAIEQRRVADKTAIVRLIPEDSSIRAWRAPNKVGYVNYKAAQTAWD